MAREVEVHRLKIQFSGTSIAVLFFLRIIESSVDKEDLKRFNCQSFQVFFPFINNTGLNKVVAFTWPAPHSLLSAHPPADP